MKRVKLIFLAAGFIAFAACSPKTMYYENHLYTKKKTKKGGSMYVHDTVACKHNK